MRLCRIHNADGENSREMCTFDEVVLNDFWLELKFEHRG